jgi:hypothetical protein
MCRASRAAGSSEAVRIAAGDDVDDVGEWHRAVADRTPHQTVTVSGELGAIVFEMQMPHAARHAFGEGHGVFADGERIPRVEHDADVRTGSVAECEQFLAAEVLVVFDP